MAAQEYRCLTCGHAFPWFSGDPPEVACPRCGSGEVEANPWLLGTARADVEPQEHYQALLAV